MLNKQIEKALNEQISVEANSSQFYLAMASWAETKGFDGVSSFLYKHSNEEREHIVDQGRLDEQKLNLFNDFLSSL